MHLFFLRRKEMHDEAYLYKVFQEALLSSNVTKDITKYGRVPEMILLQIHLQEPCYDFYLF
jgi:hypothetical protein